MDDLFNSGTSFASAIEGAMADGEISRAEGQEILAKARELGVVSDASGNCCG